MTEIYVSSIEAQILGRVFTYDDAIHFVLGSDGETGMARCSRRTPEGPGITYLPMNDVRQILIDDGSLVVEVPVQESLKPVETAAAGYAR